MATHVGGTRGEVMSVDEVLEQSKRTNVNIPKPQLPAVTSVEVDGVSIFHRDLPGPHPDAPTFLLVHGLGGSMASWEPLATQLAEHGRVLMPDLVGFGLTDAPAEHSGVRDNATMLAAYCAEVAASEVIAVGNSMGGLITALLAADHPELVQRLVLVDPALPLDPRAPVHPMVAVVFGMYLCGPVARRVLPRYVARVGLESLGRDGIRQVVADPDRVPEWVYERSVEEVIAHAEAEHGVATMVRAAQTIVHQVAWPSYRRLLSRLRLPVTLVHGDQDPLVPVASARRLAAAHPRWRYVEGRDVGHVPMFEVADWVCAQILHDPAADGALNAAS